MKTYLDCIPCFFKQALHAARIAGSDEITQKRILDEVARILPGFSLNSSPPEMGLIIHRLIKGLTLMEDPYSQIKAESNRAALRIYPALEERLSASDERLLTAVQLAIAGNIIDYGAQDSLEVSRELQKILNLERKTLSEDDKSLFDYPQFRQALSSARTVLYLADNAGETVFDRILIEEIRRIDRDKRIIYAVKEKPIINDALAEDAYQCAIDKVAEIVSSGSDAPGTVLSLCSIEFLKLYREADMVISKGQGNFEALSEERRSIFFLFMAKCHVVARDVGCNRGDIILYDNSRKIP
jgi:uncharacterized protein with ATP-grasp and redox domains